MYHIRHFFSNFFSKPQASITLTIHSDNGFHLRPVAKFVSLAKDFSCELYAHTQDQYVNAKAINALLSLGLEKGDQFCLKAKGKDAKEAIEQLQILFEHLMHQETERKVVEKEEKEYEGETLHGESIFAGIGIAPAYSYREEEKYTSTPLTFSQALSNTLHALETSYQKEIHHEDATIYLAQKELLLAVSEQADSLETLEKEIAKASAQLIGSKMEAKQSDYKDILQRVKKELGFSVEMVLPQSPFILLAKDLLPSQIELLKGKEMLCGVILKESTLYSHTAILLRASGIVSLIADYTKIEEKKEIILDTHSGNIVIHPSENDLQYAQRRREKDCNAEDKAHKRRFEKALTKRGKEIHILANVTNLASAKEAKEAGAEGIGLLRTEFLFTQEKPSLEKQIEAYEAIFSLFKEVTVRTLDVGGDKKLPYLTLPKEENPFLGIRGVRLFQTHPQLLEEQLHALFVASQNRPLKIMFPMVSTVEEFIEAKQFAQKVAQKYALDISALHFGMMIEVPSVLFLISQFNQVVDFYSIGTNDLAQYLFAIDRTHSSLKIEEHSPALYDALRKVTTETTKPLSLCGELAGDPLALSTLLEIGIETLSLSPQQIAQIKERIREA